MNATGIQVKGITPYLFILPIAIGVGIFGFYCLVQVFIISLSETTLLVSRYVGLDNYIQIFKDRWFLTALSHTFYYAVWVVPLNLLTGIGLGLLMFRKMRFGVVFRFIYLLPWVSSPVIVALVFRYIFNPEWGVVNWFLVNIGFPKIIWTEKAIYAIPVVAFIQVWQSIGFGMIIFLGALSGVRHEILEAASLEGANWLQVAIYITIPLLKPAMFFYLVISLIMAFHAFDTVYAFVEGVYGAGMWHAFTSPILVSSYFVYLTAFRYFAFGKAAAMAICLFLVIGGIIILQRFLIGKMNEID